MRFTVEDRGVDFLVGRTDYDLVCLERALGVEPEGSSPQQDLADLRTIFDARGNTLDRAYVERWLPPAEADLLRSLSRLDDEARVSRLLGG